MICFEYCSLKKGCYSTNIASHASNIRRELYWVSAAFSQKWRVNTLILCWRHIDTGVYLNVSNKSKCFNTKENYMNILILRHWDLNLFQLYTRTCTNYIYMAHVHRIINKNKRIGLLVFTTLMDKCIQMRVEWGFSILSNPHYVIYNDVTVDWQYKTFTVRPIICYCVGFII